MRSPAPHGISIRRTAPPGAFSIGEAAAIVGVSTHVLRSWERRLSLGLNHRTTTNQRRYWLEDIQRFIAIRQLHETAGLPLLESAARAMNGPAPAPAESRRYEGPALNLFWAALIDSLGDLLLVIDEGGRITAANSVARRQLNVKQGTAFVRLAPIGWKHTYNSVLRGVRVQAASSVLAMRARPGIMYFDVRVVRLGRRPDGPTVIIGREVGEQSAPDVATHLRVMHG